MNLRRAAVGLREAAQRNLGVRAKIKTGSRGEMTVVVDGKTVFSYKSEGSMPEISELLRRVTAAGADSTA